MAILQVNHLAKTFSNSTIVLKDISFCPRQAPRDSREACCCRAFPCMQRNFLCNCAEDERCRGIYDLCERGTQERAAQRALAYGAADVSRDRELRRFVYPEDERDV